MSKPIGRTIAGDLTLVPLKAAPSIALGDFKIIVAFLLWGIQIESSHLS
jgi:hypothetical protein